MYNSQRYRIIQHTTDYIECKLGYRYTNLFLQIPFTDPIINPKMKIIFKKCILHEIINGGVFGGAATIYIVYTLYKNGYYLLAMITKFKG